MSRSPYGAGYYPKEIPKLSMPAPELGTMRSLTRLGVILGVGGLSVAAYLGTKYWMKKSDESGYIAVGNSRSVTSLSSSNGKQPRVVLYQCPRGYTLPCISPFPLKLETFLRVAEIPYEVHFPTTFDEEGRNPWMTLGNEFIYNTHECIPLLCKTFNINLEMGAKASRLTASRFVGVMLENHIYWGITLWRWVQDKGASLCFIQPYAPEADSLEIAEVSESVRRAAFHTKFGRLPFNEVLVNIAKDMADLSAALGKHPFFLGDSPGEADCAAFAMLAQIIWTMENSPLETLLKQHENLWNFVLRMRERYWDDWTGLLTKTKEKAVAPGEFFYPVHEFQVTEGGRLFGDDNLEDFGNPVNFSGASTPTRRKSSGSIAETPTTPNPAVRKSSAILSEVSIPALEKSNVTITELLSLPCTGKPSTTSPARSRRSSNVHFEKSTTSANVQQAFNAQIDGDEFQRQLKVFDNLNQLKNVQDLLDMLNKKLEEKGGGPVQPAKHVDENFNMKSLQNLLETLNQKLDKTPAPTPPPAPKKVQEETKRSPSQVQQLQSQYHQGVVSQTQVPFQNLPFGSSQSQVSAHQQQSTTNQNQRMHAQVLQAQPMPVQGQYIPQQNPGIPQHYPQQQQVQYMHPPSPTRSHSRPGIYYPVIGVSSRPDLSGMPMAGGVPVAYAGQPLYYSDMGMQGGMSIPTMSQGYVAPNPVPMQQQQYYQVPNYRK